MENKFSFGKRLKSFGYALDGLVVFFATQVNAWLHLLAVIGVVIMGWLFDVSNIEWCFLVAAIGLVFVAEILNTSIEFLVNKVSLDHDELAGKVKDLAAAAVLIASIIALIIGLIIFIPKFL